MQARALRHHFFRELGRGLAVMWPILSALIAAIPVFGVAIAMLEGWPLFDGVYFAFVTTLTIGYGDIVPRRVLSRVLAIAAGLIGVLLIALVAAIAVRAMEHAAGHREQA
jgi:voltage-gated potassium channel Kch